MGGVGVAHCKPKSLNFPLLLDITPIKKLCSPVPLLIKDHILERKVSLITFRQILQKILPAACIFSYTVIIYLENLVRIKPFNTKQFQQDYLPELYPIIPLNLYGKPWGWKIIPPNSQKFTHFPPEKSVLINLHFPLSKVSLFPPSNSSFHLII